MTPTPPTLGQRLKAAREDWRWDHHRASHWMGRVVSPERIAAFEADAETPNPLLLGKFARVYVVSEAWLVRGEGPMRTPSQERVVAAMDKTRWGRGGGAERPPL